MDALGIELDTLFYDATNFFTYIASTNDKPKLAKRGHSKQKRTDLRLFSLALLVLVSREGQIPICSHVYEGNRVDVKSFPDSLSRIRERLAELSLDVEDVTLAFDKGNLPKANQRLVDGAPLGYVASLVPAHHPQLMEIPASEYRPLADGRLEGVPVHRLGRTLWDQLRTVVLFISEQPRLGQIHGLTQHLTKAIDALEQCKC